MVFSSHVFLHLFLPLFLAAYFLTPPGRRNLTLTLGSFVFFGWSNPAFLGLLLLSPAIDYWAGRALVAGLPRPAPGELPWLPRGGPRSRRQRWIVVASVTSNLAILGFFKYFHFGLDSVNASLAALGLDAWRLETALEVALPLGISFYTFQSMSYAIDVYRGDARAMAGVVDFYCFVAMFPQLVAGPIIRFSEVAEQLRERTHSLEKAARGAAFVCLGLAKKVLLANPCGSVADAAFGARPEALAAIDAWLGVIAYSFQIYFDFSGYSDMAIGLGLLMGFHFPKNFDSPYRAESLTEFWRRWHLSLSTWLRDYLYKPLGGSRRGALRTYRNLLLVMLLGGLWHGAAWTFVAWGGLHGLGLAAERAAGGGLWRLAPRPLRVAATFGVVLVGWVFFRATSFPGAAGYLGSMLGAAGLAPADAAAAASATLVREPYGLATLGLAALVVWGAPQTWDWTMDLDRRKVLACLAVLGLALWSLSTQGFNPFIYFIF